MYSTFGHLVKYSARFSEIHVDRFAGLIRSSSAIAFANESRKDSCCMDDDIVLVSKLGTKCRHMQHTIVFLVPFQST